MTVKTLQRPIGSEAEYTEALRNAEALMDAAPGSSQAMELGALADRIEAYEKVHHPIAEPDRQSFEKHLAENAIDRLKLD